MKNRAVAIYGLYLAVFLIMGLIPQIGYITLTPFITITTISIPVIIITIHKGINGALFGVFLWGVTAIIALPIQGVITLSYYGWWRSLVIFFVGRMLIFVPIFGFITLVRKSGASMSDNKFILLINRISSNQFIYAAIISIIVVYSNSIIVLALLAYLAPTVGSFVASFISVATGIAIEWTIIPFIIAPSLAPLAHYLRETEKNVVNDKY